MDQAGLPAVRRRTRTHNQVIRRYGFLLMIVAGMLGHSISILLTKTTHFIPTMQDETARQMDEILTPIPIDRQYLNPIS